MTRTNIVGPIRVEMKYHPPMITISNKLDGRVIDYVDMDDINEAKRAFGLLVSGLNEMFNILAVPNSSVSITTIDKE